MHNALYRLLLVWTLTVPAVGQVVTATLPVGTYPGSAAVDTTTNKIYIANALCSAYPCSNPGTVTVIDGATNNMIGTVNIGIAPGAVAVNPVTNKIYVSNLCGNDSTCQSPGTVTVIDGSTLATTTVTTGYVPDSIGINPVTNQIYVANECLAPGFPANCEVCDSQSNGIMTVINGSTLATQSVMVGCGPTHVAVNSQTNTIYVSNSVSSGGLNGTVTVVNGTTLSTQSVPTGIFTYSVAVDSATNQAYATNFCGNDPTCSSDGTVTAINGATLQSQTVTVGFQPLFVAVNPSTNNIYVTNQCGDPSCTTNPTATVTNGTTLSTAAVRVCSSVGEVAVDLEVNTTTNKIYLPCNGSGTGQGRTVTVIDGATNATLPIAVGDQPVAATINSTTNTIYAPNFEDATVSVIGGDTKLQLMNIVPCRVVDTRNPDGPFGGPPIQGGTYRSFTIPQNPNCNIPTSAAAYSFNVTVVPRGPLGYLTIWPTPEIQPATSTMNSLDGRVKANAAVVPAGVSGAVSVYVTNTTDVILDIDGYFAPANSQSLQFYAVTPCRVVDTRQGSQQPQGLGPPSLGNMQTRDLPILMSPCLSGITGAAAYSFNVTAVPFPAGQPLNYLTVWPSNEQMPGVSTLNNPRATVVANATIVPADPSTGDIDVYAYNSTDVIMDINGYFAPAGTGGYNLYPAAPCRAYDSRSNNGQPFEGERTVPIGSSPCAPPANAAAYVFNATVVPSGVMPYLTLWPDTEQQPTVSTLNAYDGFITSNMAIVPNLDGSIDAYAAGLTQLILDISGYFAP